MSLLNALTLFVILIMVYQLIISIFTVLFRLTGLPRRVARFQVVSLLTGCGFTTGESEVTLSSKRRKKIAFGIMIFGYAFTVTIMSALVNVFLSLNELELQTLWWQLSIPLVTLLILELVFRNTTVKHHINNIIKHFAEKILYKNDANRVFLLEYVGHNAIVEVRMKKVPEPFREISIRESGLRENYNILVILLERSGKAAEKVHADDTLIDGDKIIVCGNYQHICKVFEADENDMESIYH